MNFYISESIEKVNVANENIYIEDELQKYLYYNKCDVKFDMTSFFEIDPYGDTLLYSEDIAKLVEMCNAVIQSNVLDNQSAKDNFLELKDFLEKALDVNSNVVVLGD